MASDQVPRLMRGWARRGADRERAWAFLRMIMMQAAEIGHGSVCDRKQQWFVRPYRMRMTQLTRRFSEEGCGDPSLSFPKRRAT